MGRIHTLSAALANQIAAGEVVERPASVIKELVENSVDAGATSVRVDVEEGGIRLLRVRDDGHGMDADDLVLALARHATSKLRSFDDLAAVATLGFRGEALPSIASVARLRVVSRPAGAACAMAVEAHGEAFAGQAEIAEGAEGTTVEVRDLFFNTPARRRFLRTTRTEALHVEEAVRRIALARPDLELFLFRDGKRVMQARSEAQVGEAARVAAVCGREFAETSVAFDESSNLLRCRGRVSAQGGGRAHADVQHLVVNGRSVRDPLLRHAVRTALESTGDSGRHPAYVVYLTLPFPELDVNVHPTKHEVRFRDARSIHDFVASVVARATGAAVLAPRSDGVVPSARRSPLDGGSASGDDGAPRNTPGVAESPGSGETVEPGGDAAQAGDSGLARGAERSCSVPAPASSRSSGNAGRGLSAAATARGSVRPGRGARPASAAAYLALAREARNAQVAERSSSGAVALPVRLSPGYCLHEDLHGDWQLVDVARLAGAVASSVLNGRLSGAAGPANALLLPLVHRLPEPRLDAIEGDFANVAGAGIELRRTAPGEMILLEVPLALGWLADAALMDVLVSALSEESTTGRLVTCIAQHAEQMSLTAELATVADWLALAPEPEANWRRSLDDAALASAFDAAGGSTRPCP